MNHSLSLLTQTASSGSLAKPPCGKKKAPSSRGLSKTGVFDRGSFFCSFSGLYLSSLYLQKGQYCSSDET